MVKKTLGQKGNHKDTLFYLKTLKKLCIKYYGLGFILTTPKIRAVLLETMNDFINDLTNGIKENQKKEGK